MGKESRKNDFGHGFSLLIISMKILKKCQLKEKCVKIKQVINFKKMKNPCLRQGF